MECPRACRPLCQRPEEECPRVVADLFNEIGELVDQLMPSERIEENFKKLLDKANGNEG